MRKYKYKNCTVCYENGELHRIDGPAVENSDGELPKVKTLGFLLHRPLSQEMFD